MIEQLADRPANRSIDEWLKELKQTNNLNARLQERKFTVGGLPAVEVRYRSPSDGGSETGAVYVVSGSQSFAIEFSGKPGLALEQLDNYRTYTRMVETFRVNH